MDAKERLSASHELKFRTIISAAITMSLCRCKYVAVARLLKSGSQQVTNPNLELKDERGILIHFCLASHLRQHYYRASLLIEVSKGNSNIRIVGVGHWFLSSGSNEIDI